MLNITLIFHAARNDNLGVGALTESEVKIIRDIAQKKNLDVHITIVDGKGPREAYVSGPDITVQDIRVLRHPMQFYKLARKSDIVIDIGAGDSFTDIYGRKRLIVLFLMKYLTFLARRPLVLAPQTIGPFNKKISKFLAGNSIRRASIIATRDQLSTLCMQELGVKKHIIEASDVALQLPYTPAPKQDNASPVKVGINISGLLLRGGYTGKNMFGLQMDYRQLIHRIAEKFVNHSDNCELHFVPHVITSVEGELEDDFSACQEMAQAFPTACVAPAFTSPSEAKSYISGLDFFMGARMHSCIAAFSSGVPVVPMAYSRKFEGLFGSLGYDYTVDCTSDEPDDIIDNIMKAYEDRANVTQTMNVALALGKEKLGQYEQALGDLMERIAGKG